VKIKAHKPKIDQNFALSKGTLRGISLQAIPRRQIERESCSNPLKQGFPTGGTCTPKGYEIEHQGVRKSLGHRAAYMSLIEQYISQNFFGGTKNALT